MRLALTYQLAPFDQLVATNLPYVLKCRLDLHPRDQERAALAEVSAWHDFLASRQTTLAALVAGVSWSFATEEERETAAASAREALQALIGALGAHTLTPIEGEGNGVI